MGRKKRCLAAAAWFFQFRCSPVARGRLAPGAAQGLVGLPLLPARDVVAGEDLGVLARVALDPDEDQALRLAARVLLALDQHFAGDGCARLGVAVVVDDRRDLADRAARRLV